MEYQFATVWVLDAPVEPVFQAISQSLDWPQWWACVKSVEEIVPGGAGGIGNVRRYVWAGWLPYRLDFHIRLARFEPQVAIWGEASGDVEGTGRWSFSADGAVTSVRYEWHVRITSPRLRWLASMAGPLVRGNHNFVMGRGGRGLANRLNVRLLRCCHH